LPPDFPVPSPITAPVRLDNGFAYVSLIANNDVRGFLPPGGMQQMNLPERGWLFTAKVEEERWRRR
jgi:hypothetical protein